MLSGLIHGSDVCPASFVGVEHLGDLADSAQDVLGGIQQFNLFAVDPNPLAMGAPFGSNPQLILFELCAFLGRNHGVLAQRAGQQETVQESNGRGADACGCPGIDVQTANFEPANASFAQGFDRPLTRLL